MEQYLTIWDLVLTPLYLIVLILIARRIRDKRYPIGHPLRQYYLPGLLVKFGGVIFIALVYQYYYGGGDTYNYFSHGVVLNSSLHHSFTTWLKLLFGFSVDENPELYAYTSQMTWYGETSTYNVVRITAVLGLLNGTTYIPIALLFAFFSYTGIWAMYRTFVNIYPKLYKPLAVAFLFVPSTVVWGSAIFKDTICMFGLGWMTYTTFRIFVNKDFSVKNLALLVLSFYFVATIKVYILLAFLPALGLWLLLTYSHKIRYTAVRWLVNILFVGACAGGFFFFTTLFAEELNRYSLDKIAQTAQATRGWISYTSGEEGSAYDLGELDPSIGGMLKKIPQAVVVTLFRPFLWEAKKPIMFLSALEALAFSIFTFWAFKRNGLFGSFRIILKDPNLLFFLTFSLIFAFAVGISSYNFGALSRYKIPCLPFYTALLVILNYMNTRDNTSKVARLSKKRLYISRPV